MSHRQRMPQMGSRKWPRWRYVSSNMTEAEEARWVAMAQSGELRRQLAMFEKEVLRPASPRSAPSPNKPESQVGAADLPRAESGSHPDAPGLKKGGEKHTRLTAKGLAAPHPHHWLLSEPAGPVTHDRCKACGAEREFSTAGTDSMPLTLVSKANLERRGLATRFKKVAG